MLPVQLVLDIGFQVLHPHIIVGSLGHHVYPADEVPVVLVDYSVDMGAILVHLLVRLHPCVHIPFDGCQGQLLFFLLGHGFYVGQSLPCPTAKG